MTNETKKIEEPAKDEGETYTFNEKGIVVKAKNLDEAKKIYNKILEENKES